MQYDLQIENVSSIRRRLNFVVAGDAVSQELERAYQELKGRVRLPGFRPGKVPRNVLEARYGKQIRSEVGSKLIDQSYKLAVVDLTVAGSPAVEQRGDVTSGQPFSFTVAVDVRPDAEVKDYKGVKINYPLAAVTDEQVDAAAKREASGKTRIEEVTEDRVVASGDLVLASVRLEADGAVLADEPGTMLHTTGERYYPGVEQLTIGLSKGGNATAEVTIPERAELPHLKGQTVTATVSVLAIHEHKVPELSDELATELGYEGGVEGMKVAIRIKLEESAEEIARNQARVDLLQKLVSSNPVDVPRGLVEEQYQLLLEEMRIRRSYAGQDPRRIRFSDADIADHKERASFAAKASVLLSGVSRQEGVDVSNDDLDAKIQEIADMRGQAVEAIRGYLEREGAMGMLKTRVMEERVLDYLMEQAELVQVAPGALRDIKDVQGEDEAPVATQAAPAAEPAAEPAVEPAAEEAAQAEQAEPASDAEAT